MKRKIAILLSAMMVTSAMPMSASAASFNEGKIVGTAFSKANNPIDANAYKTMPTEITNAQLEERQSMLILELDEKDITGPIEDGTTFSINLENGTFDRTYAANYDYINSVNGKAVDLADGNGAKDLTTFFSNLINSTKVPMGYNSTITTKTPTANLTNSSEFGKGLKAVQAYVTDTANLVGGSGDKVILRDAQGQEIEQLDMANAGDAEFIKLYNNVNGTSLTNFNQLVADEWNEQEGKLTNELKLYIPYEFQIVSDTEAKVTIKTNVTNSDKTINKANFPLTTGAKVTDVKLYASSSTELDGSTNKFSVANIKAIDNFEIAGTTDNDVSSKQLDTPYLAIPLGGVVADTDGPIKATVTGDYTEKVKTKELSLTKNETGSTNFDYPEKNIKYFEDYATLEPIVIKENSRLTIGKSNDKTKAKVSLRLGTGFRFKASQNVANNLKVVNDAKPDQVIPTSNVTLSDNGSLLTFDLNLSSVNRDNPMGLRIGVNSTTSVVGGLQVEYINEKQFGEVSMTVSGDGINSQTKTVGKRESFGFELKTMKDPETIIAGRHYVPNNGTSNNGTMVEADNTTVEIQFSEKIPNTLVESRALDFTVPEGVKIVDAYFDHSSVRNITWNNGLEPSFEILNNGKTLRLKRDSYTVTEGSSNKNLASFRFKLDLSVDPAFSGDVKLAVTGGGQSDATETLVAKAVTPFTIETKTTKVNLGYQDYNTADITITEAKPGMFLDGKDATLELKAPYGDVNLGFSAAEFETTGSELNIKPADFKVKNGKITFSIDRASTKEPASLKIKNVKVGTNRSVPFGAYDLAFYGDAVINNYASKVDDSKSQPINNASSRPASLYQQSNTEYFKFASYVDLVTETGTFDKTVKVSVGEKTVLIGDQAVDMDVAPYIQASSNSTMVPLRFVSVALGVDSTSVTNPDESSKIAWDANTKTTTIYYGAGTGQKIIQFQAGSNIMTVDGTRIPMEYGVKAEIKDGRMFVPFRALGQALGVTVDWDADTRTAIYNGGNARNADVTTTAASTTTESTTESTTASTTTESTTASDSTTETTTSK